jgi:hypothetical protein
MYKLYKFIFLCYIIKMNQNPQTPNPFIPTTPVTPAAPAVPEDPPCEPKPCVPTEVPITLEIAPVIKLCVDKPSVTLKNNAECICTPCNQSV